MPKPTEQPEAETPEVKVPRHIAISIKHLMAQREKAIAIRDRAVAEIKGLDAALLALGWGEK